MSTECTRVLDALGQPLSPELAAHVAGCAGCRALLEGFDALESLPLPEAAPRAPDLEPVRAAALDALAAQPQATPWTSDVWTLGGLYTGLMALVMLVFSAKDLLCNTAPLGVVVGLAVLLLLSMGSALWVAFAPGRRLGWLGVGTSAVGLAVLVVLGGSGLPNPSRGFVEGCLSCVRTGSLFSLLPLAATLGMLRHMAFQAIRAVAAGLAAGAVGLFLLHVHCPDGSPGHLAVSHVGPWLVLGALAPWVRARLRTTLHAP
ncbi:MAG: NrsF family protein [Cystobacter sp.]